MMAVLSSTTDAARIAYLLHPLLGAGGLVDYLSTLDIGCGSLAGIFPCSLSVV